jgi:glutamyl-tRNA reductase
MSLLLAGLSFKTAPVEVRERLAVPEAALGDAIDALRAVDGLDEVLLVSTCNRVELSVSGPLAETGIELALDTLAARAGLTGAALHPYVYRLEEREAIRHLFRVAASLDSMVLGEPQILGQLKAAHAMARAHGALGGWLGTVVERAFTVAKRVRSETGIGRNAVSVAFAAVELARQIFGELGSKRVLLVGAGKMSELAARHLRRAGCGTLLVTNRTRARAEQMAAQVEGRVVDYADFPARLHEMDIVITSSAAPGYLLGKDDLRLVLRRRQNRPVFLVDIAVPRNVDPAVNMMENVYLYDIDDLGRAVEENRRGRQREAEHADEIIAEEIERLLERQRVREVAPLIVAVQQSLDELAQTELERLRGRLGPLTPRQEEALAAFTRGLLNKVAHGPMTEIRRAAAQPEGDAVLAAMRRMFRVREDE